MSVKNCLNCGWGIRWEHHYSPSSDESSQIGYCQYKPLPLLVPRRFMSIRPDTKPKTDCPAWKRNTGTVPPWGVNTNQWFIAEFTRVSEEYEQSEAERRANDPEYARIAEKIEMRGPIPTPKEPTS